MVEGAAGTPLRQLLSRKKLLTGFLVVFGLVGCACLVTFAAPATRDSDHIQLLASLGEEKYLHYGDYLTLKTVYNEYVMVTRNGRVYSGGYLPGADRVQILSAQNSQGVVNYGDKVTLVGRNDRYLSVHDSGKMTCRVSHISDYSVFEITGGSGPVKFGNDVGLKTMFGYVTVTRDEGRGDTDSLGGLEKYTVGRPGEEDGLRGSISLQYGMSIRLRNRYNEYLQTDKNGWVYVRAGNGDWDHFIVLSPLRREGPVRYGDSVIMRARNGNFIWTRDNGMTTAFKGRQTAFSLIGASGVIHEGDELALRAETGNFLQAATPGDQDRGVLDESGHYAPSQNFRIEFA